MGVVYPNASIEAARIGGQSPQMDAAAARTKSAVLAQLASHNKTHAYAARVSVKNVPGKRRVRDRVVSTSDPQALHIEYGHWFVDKYTLEKIKWVNGLFIFRNAFRKMGG